jgi:multisubunit Na+/H+ antiporter MnhB subunit
LATAQFKLTPGTSTNTFDAEERCSHRQNLLSPTFWDDDRDEVIRTNGRSLVIAALVIVFLCAHAPSALAAQAKPLIKVMAGYGSTDGGAQVLWFAKETKLFEKRGLDVVLVGMGTGSVSLRALIAKDLEISSLSGSDEES